MATETLTFRRETPSDWWMNLMQEDGPTQEVDEASFHQPALLSEVLEQLQVHPNGLYIDCTVGQGGHTQALLQISAPQGRVIGIDRDPRALAQARRRLEGFGPRFIPVRGSFGDLEQLAQSNGMEQADGILMDLGFSSRQINEPGYGFSFQRDEPLDMRYDPDAPLSAEDIVNSYEEEELANLIYRYGEEPRSRAVARAIVRSRPVHTTGALAEIVIHSVGIRRRQKINPATKTFQAIRIAVNDELGNLEWGLVGAIRVLAPGGRLAVISYHSLEDRMVKAFINLEAASCVCPPEVPMCVCEHQPTLSIVNRRVIRPASEEVEANPRSRSAKMRVVQRL